MMEGRGLFSPARVNPIFPRTFVEETILPPWLDFNSLVKHQLTVDVWVYFWDFWSAPSDFLTISVPVPECFDYHYPVLCL